MIKRTEAAALSLIVMAYLVLAALYALRTPDWQAPDEPAHYNYVAQLADGDLPVLEMGDWQQDYLDELRATGFDPALLDRLDTLQYEDHQPPLAYALDVPVYLATDGDLTAMRLFSVLIGAGVIVTAWATLRLLLPHWPVVALTGAGFMAFLPQHLAILGSVSNDPAAELIVALMLLACVIYLGNTTDPEAVEPPKHISPLVLGLLAGAALFTKTTIYYVAGIAVLAVLLRWWRERWSLGRASAHLAAVIMPALLIGGIWWGRNLSVYGGTDFFGLDRHDEVTVGQPRTDEYIDTMYGGSTRVYLENYAETTFHSFWGQFGWMALVMPDWVYRVFLIFTLAVLVGALLFTIYARWPRNLDGPQRDALVLFAAAVALVLAAYLLYNLDFVQFQGRYLYPALIPLALLVGIGLYGWVAPLAARIPALTLIPLLAIAALGLFALYALETYIVPNLPTW
ncbi:MAG TPA: DUF2142 domain-containing protein [Aggregatilinea sp.]|uniref:ArnT family glycosyltransferase n=1 Tax=Aggregatilinea sp. TaxID=2806333 RepID=UPI002D1C7C99|nr:DUF2142 domain-containing protein [Aggregatilinea sp.]HML21334.1 DUF2142 domain-containing protein [Aggregatilinea sp.]